MQERRYEQFLECMAGGNRGTLHEDTRKGKEQEGGTI
jgi:hypothetical protein